MARALVLYDADCGLCSWTVNFLLAWDARSGRKPQIRVTPIQSAEGDEWLGDLSPEERLASWHLIDLQKRRRVSASRAIAPALSLMPGGAAAGFLADLVPPLTAIAYRWVTEHRTELGRMLGVDACKVVLPPDPTPATSSG